MLRLFALAALLLPFAGGCSPLGLVTDIVLLDAEDARACEVENGAKPCR